MDFFPPPTPGSPRGHFENAVDSHWVETEKPCLFLRDFPSHVCRSFASEENKCKIIVAQLMLVELFWRKL